MSSRILQLFALIAAAFRRQPTLVDDWRTRNEELRIIPVPVGDGRHYDRLAGCTVYRRGGDPTPYCSRDGLECSRRCSTLSD